MTQSSARLVAALDTLIAAAERCERVAAVQLRDRDFELLAAIDTARAANAAVEASELNGVSVEGELATLRKALLNISTELCLELRTRGQEPISEKPVKRAVEIARHALRAGEQV